VESIFAAYGLPGWLGWGTIGAESSYGTNNPGDDHFFGLIGRSYKGQVPNGELAHDAEISARLYKELVAEEGLPAAVRTYSGNSYELSHVESEGKGSGAGQSESAAFSIGPLQVWPPPLLESIEPWRWIKPNLGETPPGKEVEAAKSAVDSLGGLIELLTSGEFWLRALEIVGGGILLLLGLKGLAGIDLPAVVPVPV
jgi:hypothetical protein